MMTCVSKPSKKEIKMVQLKDAFANSKFFTIGTGMNRNPSYLLVFLTVNTIETVASHWE